MVTLAFNVSGENAVLYVSLAFTMITGILCGTIMALKGKLQDILNDFYHHRRERLRLENDHLRDTLGRK